MRSSISSFSFRALTFAGVLILSACLVETYCHYSNRFDDYSFAYLREVRAANADRAVFGDSHVGMTSHISGFAFLGAAGQQSEELLLLVRHLYAVRKPVQVIVEASPQWFGEYHIGRKPILTAAALAPPFTLFGVRLLSLSEPYSKALFGNFVADIQSAIASVLGPARADVQRTSRETVSQFAKDWEAQIGSAGSAFEWSQFPAEKREALTINRVYEQNPVENFDKSAAARAFEDAVDFLKARGAQVCLFRTPVTADYLKIASSIAHSRFAAFDNYVTAFAKFRQIRLVDFRSLPMTFDDSKFNNQDHLSEKTATIAWPLVANTCFDAATR